jgi:hypothetical protein
LAAFSDPDKHARVKKRIAVAVVSLVAAFVVYLVGDYALSANFETYGATLRVRSLLGSYETDSFRTYTPELCDRLPRRAYVSGLIFNPEDRQTFYVRSNCYFEAAVATRDTALCALVREKRHLLLDGSYYRAERCRLAVERAGRQ